MGKSRNEERAQDTDKGGYLLSTYACWRIIVIARDVDTCVTKFILEISQIELSGPSCISAGVNLYSFCSEFTLLPCENSVTVVQAIQSGQTCEPSTAPSFFHGNEVKYFLHARMQKSHAAHYARLVTREHCQRRKEIIRSIRSISRAERSCGRS